MNDIADYLLSWARSAKLDTRYWAAKARVATPSLRRDQVSNAPVFIMGCGRSGTTILGEMLACHPQIDYRFEPYHTWTAIDKITDASNLFGSGCGNIFLKREDCSELTQMRFRRLFRAVGNRRLIEKTPHNSMRIEYLEAIAPGAKFIHIVRDGIDVVESIHRIASSNQYRLSGRDKFNSWWGPDDYKWRSLRDGGVAKGIFAEEVRQLQSHYERGSYEWLVSLMEVEKQRDHLKDRLLEVRFEDISSQPEIELHRMAAFAEIEVPSNWLRRAIAMIEDRRRPAPAVPQLPEEMAHAFASYRSKFGYDESGADCQQQR